MQQSNVRTDNPQERLHYDLAWLAGLIDGEGSFNLNKRFTKKSKSFVPRIYICNTNPIIIEECENILKDAGIAYYISKRDPIKTAHSARFDLIIAGFKRCNNALNILLPHLRGKKPVAEVMAEFIKVRMEKYKKHHTRGKSHYTEKELSMHRQMQILNATGLYA